LLVMGLPLIPFERFTALIFLLVSLTSHSLNRGYSGKGKTNKQKSSIHAGLRRDGSPKAEHK